MTTKKRTPSKLRKNIDARKKRKAAKRTAIAKTQAQLDDAAALALLRTIKTKPYKNMKALIEDARQQTIEAEKQRTRVVNFVPKFAVEYLLENGHAFLASNSGDDYDAFTNAFESLAVAMKWSDSQKSSSKTRCVRYGLIWYKTHQRAKFNAFMKLRTAAQKKRINKKLTNGPTGKSPKAKAKREQLKGVSYKAYSSRPEHTVALMFMQPYQTVYSYASRAMQECEKQKAKNGKASLASQNRADALGKLCNDIEAIVKKLQPGWKFETYQHDYREA